MNSKKKFALVTGGSRGIGKAIAIELAAQGYHIIINYSSNVAAAESVASIIKSMGVDAILLPFNVGDKDAVKQAFDTFIAQEPQGVVEVLVNNAGIRNDVLLAFMEDHQWQDVIDTSLGGMYHVTRTFLQPMLLNRYGRIINVVSLSGIKGMSGQVNYSAAKAGMIGATKALAQEVAKRNITVNAVAPGFIKTDMTEDLDEQSLKGLIPMNRFGEAEEVAKLVGFLASRNAGYITGQVISINGGLYT